MTCESEVEEAASELVRGTFHLVITDLSFPQANLSLIDVAKQHQIPVVVISGDIALLFREPYADLYLETPVAPQELLAIVKELLSCREKEPQGSGCGRMRAKQAIAALPG